MPRWVTPLFAGMAISLLPWVVVLYVTLPRATQAHHWSIAWIGFDLLVAATAATTAWLARRGDPRATVTATATGSFLLVDAWFDITTAAPGGGLVLAILLAVAVELPLALLCLRLAFRGRPAA